MSGAYRRETSQLDNGLTVVALEMPHLHTATISLFARAGSRHETKETNGLSHFLEHMYFRGCEGFSDSTALNAAMEDLGGTLDGYTMRDLSGYTTTVHPDFAKDALEILGMMFRAPTFRDIDIERKIILEEMLDSIDDRGRVVDLDTIAHREAFKGHPLGQPIDGSRKNVRHFSVQDLEKHRKKFYGAKNLIVCCAGQINARQTKKTVARYFSDLPVGRRAKEASPKLPIDTPRFTYVRSNDAQTRVRISFRTTSEVHDDHAALLLLRRYLDGGLSAKLQVELVERTGLAYEVAAELESYSDCGLFDLEFAVAHPKLPTTFERLGAVIAGLKREVIDDAELERIRRRARISVTFGLDSGSELSHWFGPAHLFRAPETPEEQVARFDAVDGAKLRSIVQKYFRVDRLTIAAVGGADADQVRMARRAAKSFGESL